MAGALTISTLNDSSGVLATQNGMSGIAKAWVNFNGSGGSIRASFNVSSITVNGTGDYTANFTTAMPDVNYSLGGAGTWDGTNIASPFLYTNGATPYTMTTSAVRFQMQRVGAGTLNLNYVFLQVFK